METTTRRRLLAALAAVVLVAALAVIATGQLWLHGQRADDDRADQVREAADRAVTAVLSYDYRRLDQGVADTTPLLTGDALAQYEEVQRPLARTAPKLHAVVSAEVKTSTVLEADDDSARLLLFVDQVSSSRKLTQPQLDQSRVVVTMQRKGDDWLVSSLSAI
ncbi:MAG TPA: hypothetical protein VNS55_00995 [Nocardioides sp.]|nr:hypothetical protein [Nocardioides sp.]